MILVLIPYKLLDADIIFFLRFNVYHFLQADPNFTPSNIEKETNMTGNKVYKTKVPILNEILFRRYKSLNYFPSLVENIENLNLLNFFHKLSLRNRYQISSLKLNRVKKMNLSEKTPREIYELYK